MRAIIYIISATEGTVAQLLPDDVDKVSQETMGDYTFDHFYDNEGGSNAYVCHNEDGTLFYLGETNQRRRVKEAGIELYGKIQKKA